MCSFMWALALLFLLHTIMTAFNRRAAGAFYQDTSVQIGRYERTRIIVVWYVFCVSACV